MLDRLYCRACGISNPDDIIKLSNRYRQQKSWHEIFYECTSIGGTRQDQFSKVLCKICKDLLITLYEFRILAQKTHDKLLKEAHQIEIKHEELISDGLELTYNNKNIMIKDEVKFEIASIDGEFDHIDIEGDIDFSENDRKSFNRSVRKQHISRMRYQEIQCPGCHLVFKKSGDFNKHLIEKQGAHDHIWQCDLCSTNFNKKCDVYGHIKRMHKESICSKCNEICVGINEYHKHIVKVHNSTSERHSMCPHCGKLVKNVRSHVQHVHKKLKKYSCDMCDKKFFSKHGVREHFRVHTNERPFKCKATGCDKSFKQAGQLKQHQERHGPRQAFICDVCGLNVSTKYYLIEHRKAHFQVASFNCDECNATFSKPNYLKDHKKNMHTEYTPAICQICGSAFKNETRLNVHLKMHKGTEHICSECNKMFLKRSQMMEHITAVHEKIRNFVCQWEGCDKAYLQRNHLRRHEKKYHLKI